MRLIYLIASWDEVIETILRAINYYKSNPIISLILILFVTVFIIFRIFLFKNKQKTRLNEIEKVNNDFVKRNKNLIAKNKIESVIENLKTNEKINQDQELLNQVVHLSSRFNKQKEKEVKGIKENDLESNKIINGLLTVLNEIKIKK